MATAGARAGKGGKGRGGRKGGLGATALKISNAQVSAAEQPILQQIQAERAANLAKAKQVMGFSKGAAALLQAIAPRVQATYNNAANADASYARGLGDVAQSAVANQAAGDNAFLQKMGTPGGAMVKPADVGGTAYGLQGYIPATTLQREGAAFTSAANELPGDVISQGNQNATAALNDTTNLAKLQSDLAKVAATQPEVYQKMLTTLSDMGYKKAELKLSAERIAQGNARLAISQQNANTTAAHLNFDMTQATIKNRQEWARIGISKRSLQIRAAAAERKLKGSGGTAALTPDKIIELKQYAASAAQAMHDGVPATSTKKAVPPISSWKQAMKEMILHGVPPSIALMELKGAGYKVPAPSIGGQAGNDILGSLFSGPISPQKAMTPQGAKSAGFQMAAQYGWGNAAQLRALDEVVQRESGWNYKARNPKSGALGIGQELGHRLPPGYANNPLVQIKWMLDYIQRRYGTPEAAWQHEQQFGWY